MIWPHVTKQRPCPVCGSADWCQYGDRAVKCMRVESERPVDGSDGWYHFYENVKGMKAPPPRLPARKAEGVVIPAAEMMHKWRQSTSLKQYESLAISLGIAFAPLMEIGAAYASEHRAWAFQMHDGAGNVVGIRLRNSQGFKWAVTGSQQGLFLSTVASAVSRIDCAYLPEGPTDSAAALSLGLFPIGRPTCSGGAEAIRQTLRRLGIYKAVIVADNDDMKKLGPREGRPGLEGAVKIKKELGVKSAIWIPPSPCKDLREFVRMGGVREIIESDVNNKVWSK